MSKLKNSINLACFLSLPAFFQSPLSMQAGLCTIEISFKRNRCGLPPIIARLPSCLPIQRPPSQRHRHWISSFPLPSRFPSCSSRSRSPRQPKAPALPRMSAYPCTDDTKPKPPQRSELWRSPSIGSIASNLRSDP